MDYKAVRDRIEDMANNNHRDFVKVIISIEKGINDERDIYLTKNLNCFI